MKAKLRWMLSFTTLILAATLLWYLYNQATIAFQTLVVPALLHYKQSDVHGQKLKQVRREDAEPKRLTARALLKKTRMHLRKKYAKAVRVLRPRGYIAARSAYARWKKGNAHAPMKVKVHMVKTTHVGLEGQSRSSRSIKQYGPPHEEVKDDYHSAHAHLTNHSAHEQPKSRSAHEQVRSRSAHEQVRSRFAHEQVRSRSAHEQVRSRSAHDQHVRSYSVHEKTPSRGIRVIIIAYGRSGSSFFSGIFNAHPDIFFLYEPIYTSLIRHPPPRSHFASTAWHVINDVLNCNMSDTFIKQYIEESHHRSMSRQLVSPPFCSTTPNMAIDFQQKPDWKLCNTSTAISAHALNKICRNYSHVVTKVLLEHMHPVDLTWLWKIANHNQANIVYLVRDPRAMFYSRFKLGWFRLYQTSLETDKFEDTIRIMCDMMTRNINAVFAQNLSRTTLVRYEDLATDPEDVTRRLFNNFGITFPDELSSWIRKKSEGAVSSDVFSLSRPGKWVMSSWRQKIPLQLVNIVESKCGEVMKKLGYIFTYGSPSLLRDRNRTIFHENIIL